MVDIGYSVYPQEWHHRWAGYGVPGICDHPGCDTHIDRGLYYKCEEHLIFKEDDLEEEHPISSMGCDLFFCDRHQGAEFEKHFDWEAKPDVKQWLEFMLTDPSWEKWREHNPAEVASIKWQIAESEGEEDND